MSSDAFFLICMATFPPILSIFVLVFWLKSKWRSNWQSLLLLLGAVSVVYFITLSATLFIGDLLLNDFEEWKEISGVWVQQLGSRHEWASVAAMVGFTLMFFCLPALWLLSCLAWLTKRLRHRDRLGG